MSNLQLLRGQSTALCGHVQIITVFHAHMMVGASQETSLESLSIVGDQTATDAERVSAADLLALVQ